MTPPSTSDLFETLHQHNQDAAIYQQAALYALAYLKAVRERRVFPDKDALAALEVFDEPLPDAPYPMADTLKLLHEVGSPATVAQGGGRYFGFVNGGVLPGGLAARWLADAWDQNGALQVMSPIAAKLEAVCEAWLVELFGLPDGTGAGFVTGTSSATMCGLLAGRDTLLRKAGWDASEQGLFGAPPLRVVTSEQAHGTVRKALSIIGLGAAQIEWVAADDQGRLDATQLPDLDERTLVILQAGNVNSGAFDPFEIVCQKAQEAGAWVHVDGAFGLWAAACEQTRAQTIGVELADSWSVDMHKTLNAPYDNGAVLCADRSALVQALQASGSYMQFGDQRDGMLTTLDMSRRARGIDLWATLKTLGRSGTDALVAQLCNRAQLFADLLGEEGFRVLNDVVFNQVVVACDAPETTLNTLQRLQASGECWCGGSNWRGEPVIRISVCSWATTEDDVRRSVLAFVAARG